MFTLGREESRYRIGMVDKLPWFTELNHTLLQIVQGSCRARKAQCQQHVPLELRVKRETKKGATCLATLLQNELNSNVARFTTHEEKTLQPYLLQDRLERGR